MSTYTDAIAAYNRQVDAYNRWAGYVAYEYASYDPQVLAWEAWYPKAASR
jgi:hypothetical protein